jgi:hypothetical protein
MDNSATFSCNIGTTDASASIGIEIWLDDIQIFNDTHVRETIFFQHEFSDVDGDHRLRFVMKNKTPDDTVVDDAGNILKDARLVVSNLSFEEIELNQLVFQRTVYTHNFNGTQDTIKDEFYGEMGCNGTVDLEFTTPIYLWLLEHM